MAPYTPTTWVNDGAPALTAANLNHLTNELKAQALAKSIAHTLPTWVDGGHLRSPTRQVSTRWSGWQRQLRSPSR